MAEEEITEETTITEDNAYPDWDKVAGGLGLTDEDEAPEIPDVSFGGEEAQPDQEADEAPPETDEIETEVETAVTPSPEMESLKARLKMKAGATDADFADKSEDDLSAWWGRIATREAGVDEAFRSKAELEKIRAAESVESVETVPATLPDLVPSPEMEEELGESGAKVVAGWVQKQVAALVAPIAKQLEANEAATQTQQARGIWDSMVSAGEFGDELPTSAFGDVTKQAVALSGIEGPWSSLQGEDRAQSLYRAAARLAMPDTSPSAGNTDEPAEHDSARKNGTATRVTQRRKPQRQATKEEVQDAKLHAIVFGGETDGAKLKRKYGSG